LLENKYAGESYSLSDSSGGNQLHGGVGQLPSIPLTHLVRAVAQLRIIVTVLARARKHQQETKLLVDSEYEDKNILYSHINYIITAVKDI
jgi:hypothetical protein